MMQQEALSPLPSSCSILAMLSWLDFALALAAVWPQDECNQLTQAAQALPYKESSKKSLSVFLLPSASRLTTPTHPAQQADHSKAKQSKSEETGFSKQEMDPGPQSHPCTQSTANSSTADWCPSHSQTIMFTNTTLYSLLRALGEYNTQFCGPKPNLFTEISSTNGCSAPSRVQPQMNKLSSSSCAWSREPLGDLCLQPSISICLSSTKT